MPLKLETTLTILFGLSALAMACGIGAILLLQQTKVSQERELYYLVGIAIGAGAGCLTFRLFAAYVVWIHFIVHTVSLGAALYGRRPLVDKVRHHHWRGVFNDWGVDFFALSMYVGQYLLGIHLMVFRYGRTPRKKFMRTGLHTYLGILSLFSFTISGCCRIHIFPVKDNSQANDNNTVQRMFLLFACGALTWFLLLHPLFDWRTLGLRKLKEQENARKREKRQSAHEGSMRGGPRRSRGSIRARGRRS